MRVKVGDTWYEATPEQPIMVELEKHDKANIASMPIENKLYAIFHDDSKLTREQMFMWMADKKLEQETAPANCRSKLRKEGKSYPRSSCKGCGATFATGLKCPYGE